MNLSGSSWLARWDLRFTRLGLSVFLAVMAAALVGGSVRGWKGRGAIARSLSAAGEDSSLAGLRGLRELRAPLTFTHYLPAAFSQFRADVYPDCRFGVGQAYNPLDSYNITPLSVGWYLSWGTQRTPPRPGGIEYVQVLRVSDEGYSPSGSALADVIAANPGSLWLVGNEPDCIYQDDVLPQNYASIYHDAYTFIKGHDPTAQVAAGSIVQPTPLRMEYLDVVLDAYASLYGQSLPTDAWNIHTFILREASCEVYPGNCWGAEIPPGIDVDHGMLYTLDDTDRLDIFQARVVQFRRWMRDRGYRDTPLIITEYGTLIPYYDPDSLYYDSSGAPFDGERARDFMYGTFDFLLTASDPDLGYPADENRLVQRWLWYSLDDTGYGGALFDRLTLKRLQLGADFAAYTGVISPAVDLLAVDVGQVGEAFSSSANTMTVTVRAQVSNVGNVATNQPVTVRFLDGEGGQIGSDQVISASIAGCAASREVSATWKDLRPGAYVVRAVVDPDNVLPEADEGNNDIAGDVLIATGRVLLPAILKEQR